MNIFFPSAITEWNKHILSIRNSTGFSKSKGKLLQFIKHLENGVYTCHIYRGIKYLTSQELKFGFIQLCYQKNLSMVFQVLLIYFEAAEQQSKKLFITSFTVPTFQLCQIRFSMKLLLTDQFLAKKKSKLFKLSFMVINIFLPIITN